MRNPFTYCMALFIAINNNNIYVFFFLIINNIKLHGTHRFHQAQEASFQETAETLSQTDSTFQQVSYYINAVKLGKLTSVLLCYPHVPDFFHLCLAGIIDKKPGSVGNVIYFLSMRCEELYVPPLPLLKYHSYALWLFIIICWSFNSRSKIKITKYIHTK